MYYELKNGKSILIRKPCIDDAEQIIDVMKTADEETKFWARQVCNFGGCKISDFVKILQSNGNRQSFLGI